MLNRTKSILEELDNMYIERDLDHIVESRAENLVSGVIRLMEFIDQKYDEPAAEVLNRKLLNAIKSRDVSKFRRGLARTQK
jgi:hypothetical protein